MQHADVPKRGTSATNDARTAPSAAEIRTELVTAIETCRVLSRARLDARDAEALRAITELVRDALRISDASSAAFPEAEDETPSDGSTASSTAEMEIDPAREVPLVVFAVRAELRPLLQRLERPNVDLESEGPRALRRVAKTLTALDVALAEATGSTSTLPPAMNLRESIATRRHYARVRRAIKHDREPSRAGLERVRIHLTLLAADDLYAALRPGDRARLDELRVRVSRLASTESGLDENELARLWQDLVGFATFIAEISRRHELVENDTRVIVEAHATLRTAQAIPPRLRARLDMLAGLDDDLDRLIEDGHWDADAWRREIDRLHGRMAEPVTGRFLAIRTPESTR